MKFHYITEQNELDRALNVLERSAFLFLDTETTRDSIRLIQLGDGDNIYVIDLFELPSAVEKLQKLISRKGIVGHNLKFDIKQLNKLRIVPYATFDTLIASQILGFERHSLRHLADVILGKVVDKSLQLSDWSAPVLSSEQIRYAATDVYIVRELFFRMRDRLNSLPQVDRGQELLKTRTARVFGLTNPAVIIEMAFVQEVAKLELRGIPVDLKEVERLSREYERALQKLHIDFYTRHRIDPMSPKQVGNLLTGKLGLSLPETRKGNIATDDRTLSMYAHIEEVSMILEIRRIKKALDKLREIASEVKRGRIYPEFKQIGAVTGRMASSHPNVQNIPRDMRSLFRTEEGNIFVIADFSQIELRIAAEYVGDSSMVRAFKEGKDLHRYTASLVLEKPEDEVNKEERQIAKAMNFGLIYGISARGLSEYARSSYGANIDPSSADTLRKKFFQHFHAFLQWHEKVKKELKEKEEVKGTTLLGRPYRALTFTDAVNYPIQGTGADLLKLAVLMFDVEIKKRGLKAFPVNLIHDEILVECPEGQEKEVQKSLEEAMVRAGRIVLKEVPVEVDSSTGKSWEKS